jgi:hypothetical protein
MLTKEASLENQKMINIIINSTSGDSSCLGMTPNLMSFPFCKCEILKTTYDEFIH